MIHTPLCAATSIERTFGRMEGNERALIKAGRLNSYTSFLHLISVFWMLVIQYLSGGPANTKTTLIDYALAKNLGACETGPAEWPQGTTTSKYSTCELNFTPEFKAFYEGDDTYQRLALYKGDTCLFERCLTDEGYTQKRHPLFNPTRFREIDLALSALLVSSDDPKQAFQNLRDFMNTQDTRYI